MDWSLFALQSAKEGEELLLFVRQQYTMPKYRTLNMAQPQVKLYVMQAELDLYIVRRCS
jgi:hypothetical protein